MFLVIPVFLTGYCFYVKNSKVMPSIFLGLMSAVLLCAFKTFFLYAHRIIPYNLIGNISFLLIRQTLLPIILLVTLFFVFSRDDLYYKAKSICPILLSFYMIYLPYSIVTTSEGLYSGYSLFVKPLVFISMIFSVSYFAEQIIDSLNKKKYIFIILFSLCALCSLIIPAIIEACVVIGDYLFIQIFLSVLYCLLPCFIFCLPLLIKKIKK